MKCDMSEAHQSQVGKATNVKCWGNLFSIFCEMKTDEEEQQNHAKFCTVTPTMNSTALLIGWYQISLSCKPMNIMP
jgi:amino acid permease